MLELRNIRAGYGDTVVLRDVSLAVPGGAVVALIGPNGAGKTTLLRVASGLLRPVSGQILVDGTDATLWSADRLARAGVCHVPEGRGIFRSLLVRDNLRLQRRGSKTDGGLALATEAFPKLGQRLTQKAGTMSGGEQQMLALAHAYLPSSKMVLLDEVSMGLAPVVVDEIFEHLKRLAARGTALLLVEQFVQRALEMADYVYVLKKGRLVFVGEPAQLGDRHLLDSYLGG